MKLQAYPRTKASGVEWLGDVPEHWEVKRLSYLATLKSGENITSEMIAEDGDYPVYGGNGLRGNYHKFTHRGHHALIGRQGALCGNINYASGEFWASEHALVVSPLKEFAVVWMGELLRAMNLGQYSVTAAQPGIAAEMIRGLRIPVPPLPEQRSIAAFLDRETGRVDRLVAKKRELIERLKEKRTALISRTVTRGLPPAAARAAGLPANPPLKPSALDWLGNIPKHWSRTSLKRVVSVRGRIGFRGYTTDDLVDEGEGALALGGANLTKTGRLDFTKRTYLSWFKYEESPEIKIEPGDLVIGQRGTCGDVVLIDRDIGPATINPSLVLLKQPEIHGSFLCYWLMGRFVQSIFDTYLSATAVPMLSQEQIGDAPVCHPPLPEQAAIAAYLDEETAKLDALVGKVEEAVERLQEYRTALITAAVTGKIDVRHAAVSA